MSAATNVLSYQVESLLREHGALTANELAARLSTTAWGIGSTLNAMCRRGDVRRLRARPGSTEPRFGLRSDR